MKGAKVEYWCGSESIRVGDVWVVVDQFGRCNCRKAVAERVRVVSLEEREDADDLDLPVGKCREIGVVTVSEEEAAKQPGNALVLGDAAARRRQLEDELRAAAVVYETEKSWWVGPRAGENSPSVGDCYAMYMGFDEYAWYRKILGRVQILKIGSWEKAVRDARKNDYLRQDEANTPAEVFAQRRALCEQYAELPYASRETLLAVIAAM